MRAGIVALGVAALAGVAQAGPQFAALDFVSVSPASGASVFVNGEGSSVVGLTGDLGPFFPGAFSVTFGLTFDSFSVSGDGVMSMLSFQPSNLNGALQVTNAEISAQLYNGAEHVSSLTSSGQAAAGARGNGSFDVYTLAQAFSRDGAAPFEFIGDHGSIQVTIDFLWSGVGPNDTLRLDVLEGSEIAYLAFIPSPGTVAVMGLSALGVMRRRR